MFLTVFLRWVQPFFLGRRGPIWDVAFFPLQSVLGERGPVWDVAFFPLQSVLGERGPVWDVALLPSLASSYSTFLTKCFGSEMRPWVCHMSYK